VGRPEARFDFAGDAARLPGLGCRARLPWLKFLFSEGTLARVTVEDCLEKVNNRFALVILGAERARQLANGGRALVACNNKPAVTSLREIAKGQVHFNESVEGTVRQYIDEVKSRGNRPEKSR
jgi:DNA-directed RNA polymerase subunit omega